MQNTVLIFILSFFGVLNLGTSALAQDKVDTDSLVVEIQSADTVFQDSTSRSNGEQIDEIVSFAKKFLGTPYYYSGITPAGFDCSGFIYYVMGNFGLQLTHSSYGLAEFGKTVKLSELKPGDLMFFKGRNLNTTRIGHVGMVVEVTETEIFFIHASSSRGVVIDNFKTSKYYIPRFIKAKRLDYGEIQ
jgi:cell wall-associated NlpC family hydrolase